MVASGPVHSPADPLSFPVQPPTRDVAELLFSALQRNVEFMEAKLRSTQRRYAKARRHENPSLLFRDLKGERPAQVESLVEGPNAVVEEVWEAEGTAVLAGETSWIPGAPFMQADTPLEVHHAEPDCLYGDVSALRKGCTVQQYRCVGDLPGCLRLLLKSGLPAGLKWVILPLAAGTQSSRRSLSCLLVSWPTRLSQSRFGSKQSRASRSMPQAQTA